jgi:hypothetical protein
MCNLFENKIILILIISMLIFLFQFYSPVRDYSKIESQAPKYDWKVVTVSCISGRKYDVLVLFSFKGKHLIDVQIILYGYGICRYHTSRL